MPNLEGKVVLITGGSSGIGKAVALRLAARNCKLVLAARQEAPLREAADEVKAAGASAMAVPADVSAVDQCQKLIQAAVETFGRLDVLICSAGISMRSYFAASDLAAMERVFKVNFFGTLYATYFAIPHVEKSRGSLVAISSLTGRRGIPSYGIYGASKFAIEGLYESLRLELGRKGVHVGVVSPGFLDTPLRERVLGPDGKIWPDPPPPPFRIWPVEKCANRVMRLLERRQARALVPWFTGPLLTLDQALGGRIGDWILGQRFPPENS
jgi:NAD(P)-dependent dehydrogenase (short-subunit alcohol dehydrogenase family)